MYKIVFRTDPDTNKSVKVMNPVSSDAEFRALRDSERTGVYLVRYARCMPSISR